MPDLVLYHFEWCPFCVKVRQYLQDRGIKIKEKDTRQDPQAQAELIDKTGRTQVPCLFIDGEPLFESGDIVKWFEDNIN